jgi:plastocyanin
MRLIQHSLIVAAVAAILLPAFAFAATVDVQMEGLNFVPNPVIVQEGDIVRWTNPAATTHTTTSGSNCIGDGLWNSGNMSNGAQFTVQFDNAGDFPYFCIPHCGLGMTGTVTVEPNPTGIDDIKLQYHRLGQNYPNPFNPNTAVDYTVGGEAHVEIAIFNSKGQLVRKIEDTVRQSGSFTAHWDARDATGVRQASGIYFYQMKLDGISVETRKMVLLR